MAQYRQAYGQGYSLSELQEMTHAPKAVLQMMMQDQQRTADRETASDAMYLYVKGASEKQAAGLTGISQSSVSKIFSSHWFDIQPYQVDTWERRRKNIQFKLSPVSSKAALEKTAPKLIDYREIVKQYRDLMQGGMPKTELAEKSGAPLRTLQRMMQPLVPGKMAERAIKIVNLRLEDKTLEEIAVEVKVSKSYVSTILKELEDSIDKLVVELYKDMIDDWPRIPLSHEEWMPAIIGINEKDLHIEDRRTQLRNLARVNKKNYEKVIPRWEPLAYALTYICRSKTIYLNSGPVSQEEYFKQTLGIPLSPVKVLVEAYSTTNRGPALYAFPPEDRNELIHMYYLFKKKKNKRRYYTDKV